MNASVKVLNEVHNEVQRNEPQRNEAHRYEVVYLQKSAEITAVYNPQMDVEKVVARIRTGKGYEISKRLLDITLSFAALVFLSPIYLILSVIVYVNDPGPVFYGHERLGKNGKKIKVWKFRSMYVNADEIFERLPQERKEEFYKEFKIADDPRITKIGDFLRRTSLDELPQFVNVLKGEISLVGPRPIVEKELEKYAGREDKFLSVKPGLTGYWQTNGRSNYSYSNGRQEMELYYIDHRSMWMDLKILFRTVKVVFCREGAE